MTAPAVYGAINKVKLALARDGIAKGKTTQAQGRYQYRGVDDVMDACAMPMAEAGVCVFQRTISHRIEEHKSNANSTLFYCYVECEFDFVASEDGSMHTARFVGESFDSGDKSTGKAETYAYRNCLIKTFVIPVNGAEADSDKHESPPVQHRSQQRNFESGNPAHSAGSRSTTQDSTARRGTSAADTKTPSVSVSNPSTEPTKPLPTRTSKNYPVTQYAEVPFTSMPSSALTAYIQHYESRLPTLDNEHHRAAAKMSILAAQKELEARRQEEMKSGSASA